MAEAATRVRENMLSFIWSQILSSHGPGWLRMAAVSLGTTVKYLEHTRSETG